MGRAQYRKRPVLGAYGLRHYWVPLPQDVTRPDLPRPFLPVTPRHSKELRLQSLATAVAPRVLLRLTCHNHKNIRR